MTHLLAARAASLALIALAFAATGCSRSFEALGTHTASVSVGGRQVAEHPRISCRQVQWQWFIETLEESPGFRAQVHTGRMVDADLIRFDDVAGFTGSAWDDAGTPVTADATLVDGTFTITGTATGYFDNDPGETTTTPFEIRTDC